MHATRENRETQISAERCELRPVGSGRLLFAQPQALQSKRGQHRPDAGIFGS